MSEGQTMFFEYFIYHKGYRFGDAPVVSTGPFKSKSEAIDFLVGLARKGEYFQCDPKCIYWRYPDGSPMEAKTKVLRYAGLDLLGAKEFPLDDLDDEFDARSRHPEETTETKVYSVVERSEGIKHWKIFEKLGRNYDNELIAHRLVKTGFGFVEKDGEIIVKSCGGI